MCGGGRETAGASRVSCVSHTFVLLRLAHRCMCHRPKQTHVRTGCRNARSGNGMHAWCIYTTCARSSIRLRHSEKHAAPQQHALVCIADMVKVSATSAFDTPRRPHGITLCPRITFRCACVCTGSAAAWRCMCRALVRLVWLVCANMHASDAGRIRRMTLGDAGACGCLRRAARARARERETGLMKFCAREQEGVRVTLSVSFRPPLRSARRLIGCRKAVETRDAAADCRIQRADACAAANEMAAIYTRAVCVCQQCDMMPFVRNVHSLLRFVFNFSLCERNVVDNVIDMSDIRAHVADHRSAVACTYVCPFSRE